MDNDGVFCVIDSGGYFWCIPGKDLIVADVAAVNNGDELNFRDGKKIVSGKVLHVSADEDSAQSFLSDLRNKPVISRTKGGSFHEDQPRKAALNQRTMMKFLTSNKSTVSGTDEKKKANGNIKLELQKKRQHAQLVMELGNGDSTDLVENSGIEEDCADSNLDGAGDPNSSNSSSLIEESSKVINRSKAADLKKLMKNLKSSTSSEPAEGQETFNHGSSQQDKIVQKLIEEKKEEDKNLEEKKPKCEDVKEKKNKSDDMPDEEAKRKKKLKRKLKKAKSDDSGDKIKPKKVRKKVKKVISSDDSGDVEKPKKVKKVSSSIDSGDKEKPKKVSSIDSGDKEKPKKVSSSRGNSGDEDKPKKVSSSRDDSGDEEKPKKVKKVNNSDDSGDDKVKLKKANSKKTKLKKVKKEKKIKKDSSSDTSSESEEEEEIQKVSGKLKDEGEKTSATDSEDSGASRNRDRKKSTKNKSEKKKKSKTLTKISGRPHIVHEKYVPFVPFAYLCRTEGVRYLYTSLRGRLRYCSCTQPTGLTRTAPVHLAYPKKIHTVLVPFAYSPRTFYFF